ncbi:MAG: hypothetical protein AAF657_34350 [Acidobacteriota bacterium]
MRNITRFGFFALVFALLAPGTFADSEASDQPVAVETESSSSIESTTEPAAEAVAEPVQEESSQSEVHWLSTDEPIFGAEASFLCSTPPPSCQCGNCCECYTCWNGGFLYFGCDI